MSLHFCGTFTVLCEMNYVLLDWPPIESPIGDNESQLAVVSTERMLRFD